MPRLVDMKAASSPEEARLTELVAASQPTTLSNATRARVYDGVMVQQHGRRTPAFGRMLRPALASIVLLLASVAAGATFGRHWLAKRLQIGPAAVGSATEPARGPRATAVAEPGRRIEPPAAVVPPEDAVEPPRPTSRPVPPPHRSHPSRGEDPSRVVAAIQTLRNDHDPERASQLLDEYLRIYPRGALAEEALALSIEAAAARHQPARAAAFADRYLKEYPNGRFRRAAQQAQSVPAR